MTDVARRDLVVTPADANDASPSPMEGAGCDRVWSESAISGLTQVMLALCFDQWIEEPLRLGDFVA